MSSSIPTEPEKPPVAVVAAAALNAENAVLTAPANTEPKWAKPAIALMAMFLLGMIIIYAFVTKDSALINMCFAAVVPMAAAANHYFTGSSAGSDRKTDLLAAAAPVVVK